MFGMHAAWGCALDAPCISDSLCVTLQYCVWAGIPNISNFHNGSAEDQFWANANAMQLVKDHYQVLVNRQNYFTGVLYKNDPTIFAWDLFNVRSLLAAALVLRMLCMNARIMYTRPRTCRFQTACYGLCNPGCLLLAWQ